MKRKICSLLFILILILSLSSCSLLFGDVSLEYDYDPQKADEIKALMVDAEGYLESGTNYDKYYEAYIEINLFAYQLITNYQKENIKYSIDGNSESPVKMQEFYTIFMEIVEWQIDILIETYNSSYKDEFFKDWSEEEIQSIFDSDYPTDYYNLSAKEEELTTKFQAFDREGKINNAASYLIELTSIRNQMAKVVENDNYALFAYDSVYGRDYSITEAAKFSNYVKKYLVPLAYKLDDELKTAEEALTDLEYYELHSQLFANSFNDRQIVDDYVRKIGNSFSYEYNYMINRGHCYYSDHPNARQAAFTTYLYWDGLPAVYFGPGYQNSFTIVHEYGHYYAAARTNEITSSNDLAETHSQGNEMLFLAYLMQFSEYSEAQKNYIEARQLYEALCVIIISSIINEFEMQVYQAVEPLTAEALDLICMSVCEGYGGYQAVIDNTNYDPVSYWKLVCVEHPCYYISYAMSLIPSIGVYEMAMSDFDNAMNCYLDLCEVKDVDFLEALSASNFYNPFNEDVYINLSELIG